MPSDSLEERRQSGVQEEPSRAVPYREGAAWRAYYRLLGQKTGDTLRGLLTRHDEGAASDWDRFRQALGDINPFLVRAIESEARRESRGLEASASKESLTPR